MSKDTIPLSVMNISDFARTLKQQLSDTDAPLSHLRLLNMLARAAGFRNYQHLRASNTSKLRLEKTDSGADFKKVERTLQHFDAQGVLLRWPSKRHVQELCLWALWSYLPSDVTLHERDVNGLLNKVHGFEDAAILRRSLIGLNLMSRNLDGSDYRRVEQAPPAEAVAVIRELASRQA